eukprot:s649_g6.t1
METSSRSSALVGLCATGGAVAVLTSAGLVPAIGLAFGLGGGWLLGQKLKSKTQKPQVAAQQPVEVEDDTDEEQEEAIQELGEFMGAEVLGRFLGRLQEQDPSNGQLDGPEVKLIQDGLHQAFDQILSQRWLVLGLGISVQTSISKPSEQVRHCPLGSGARRPALPTEIGSSQLRSGSAHCTLELAVEVRQCLLRSGAPAVPTALWSSQLRSGSACCDLELARRRREEEEEKEEELQWIEMDQYKQIATGFILLRKTPLAVQFLERWLAACEDRRIMSEEASILGYPEHPGFRNNNDDQTAFSLLFKLYGFRAFSVEERDAVVYTGRNLAKFIKASDDFALGVRSDREAYLRAADEAAQRSTA